MSALSSSKLVFRGKKYATFFVICRVSVNRSAPWIGRMEARVYSGCSSVLAASFGFCLPFPFDFPFGAGVGFEVEGVVAVVVAAPEMYSGPPHGGLRNTTSILRCFDGSASSVRAKER